MIYVDDGGCVTDYVYNGSTIFAEVRAEGGKEEVYYHHTNHLGTTEVISDGEGAIVWEASYEAFGSVLSENGIKAFAASFTGKLYDEDVGLYYFNARWYDSVSGRFITQDPARDGIGWYVYCGNSPVTNFDADGCESKYIGFIVYRDDNSKRSVDDKSFRGLDRICFYNSKTGEKFNLYNAQTYVSHPDYPIGNTVEAFMGGFSIQYLGNITEKNQTLYNGESSKYKGPVFNVQNAYLKGLGETNEYGQIIGDDDKTPIRVHSNYNINKDSEVNMASGGCLMYEYEQAEDFAAVLKNWGVEPGDTIQGYIKEYFEP